ncbi:hypothetical protein DICPUDRAFT_52896 [Dictyostelium purpureum]|uniref:Cytochrome b-c1 complex subunit 7 n=1 Tax=Dictyostelium purpureum TaxID=5786 RepID=F0ZAE2_DICPU|nr:uncharacterized protein DICPUDRAFT_52896 [Dictyostelium purpureum]EGC39134.1 hypothetical protein DICPUDRAFT_52896 [Dictyostelium purpureum]|eukprot:XP_003284386.1 hypothetical protein DICPUDRAFT_52896 [Dictyostelium purpureum]
MSFLKLLPQSVVSSIQKSSWVEYRKMGLYLADLYNTTPVVEEVYRRLPEHHLISRDRRLKVAFDLSVKKQLLPENEWSDMTKDYEYTEMIEKESEKVQREIDIRKSFRD